MKLRVSIILIVGFIIITIICGRTYFVMANAQREREQLQQSEQNEQQQLESSTITVNIPELGEIVGNYGRTYWSRQHFMQFRGIPFAESPSGHLRYKAPVARKPWQHTLDATQYGRRCPVITTISKLSEEELRKEDLEDCLNLCVYTKNLTAKQPVMFYIYGGGFYNGSASDHPPGYLLEKDIVLVVPQYRVGALGWLATRSEAMPGNVPIIDLIMALQWVHDHIATFGGSAENVTIFGQSAGSAMAGALMLSPKVTPDLFQRAIIQSGSIFAPWAINSNAYEQVENVYKRLNCTCTSDVIEESKLHECLQEIGLQQLLEATTMDRYCPIVGDLHGILPQHPQVLMENFNRKISVMAGFTKHDGTFILGMYYDTFTRSLGPAFGANVTVRQVTERIMSIFNDTTRLSNHLLWRLFDDLLDSHEHKRALPAYIDLASTIFFKSPVMALTSHLVRKQLGDTYLYSFDHEGEQTRFGYEAGNSQYPFEGGVHHSNENIYLFPTHKLSAADDICVNKQMIELWTSFAIYGKPQTADNLKVPPMKTENGPYIHINKDVTIDDGVLKEFTVTLDDSHNERFNRPDVEF